MLVGRDRERERVQRLVAAARDGRSGALLADHTPDERRRIVRFALRKLVG